VNVRQLARRRRRHGYILSTISGHKLEDVNNRLPASVVPALHGWGREVAEAALDRARLAGFTALVVTIDTPVAGMRERDLRNGIPQLLGGNVFSKIPFLPELFFPSWMARLILA